MNYLEEMPAPLPNQHIKDSRLANGRIVQNDLLCSTDCCYEVQAFLGEGVFGQVARCREVDTNKEVAIKIFKNHPDHVLMAEVAMLKRISGENPEENNFVRWYEWFQYRGHTCLVFELLELSLFDYMAQMHFRPMPLKDIKPIIQQLAIALKKLKSLGLIHTDIKPENVMLVGPVGQPFRVKMIDFGLACNISDARPGANIQTRFYRSPEVLLGLPFSEAIDMWSLGCVAVGLFLGYLLFPGRSAYEMLRYITQIQGQPAEHLLNAGAFTNSFFVKGSEWNYPRWRLKTPEEYKGDANLGSEENGRYIYRSLEELKEFKLPSNLKPTEMMAEVWDREVFVDLVRQMLRLDAGRRITPRQVLDHPFITRNCFIKSVKSGVQTLPNSGVLPVSNCETARRPVIPLQSDLAREDKRISSHMNFDTSRGVIVKKYLRVEVGSVENSHCDLHEAGSQQSLKKLEQPVFVPAVNISMSHLMTDKDRQQEHGEFGLSSVQQLVDLPKKEINIFLPLSLLPDLTSDSSCWTTRDSQNKTPHSSSDSKNAVSTYTVKPSLYQQDSLGIPSPVPQSVSLQAAQWKRKRMETELSESRNRNKMKLEQPFPVPKTCSSPLRGGVEDGQHGHVATSLSALQQILQQRIPPVKMEQTQTLLFLPFPTPPDPTNDAPSLANKSDFQRHQADRLSSSLGSGEGSPLITNHTSSSQQNNLPNLAQQSVPLQAAQWGKKRIQTDNTKSSQRKGPIAELLKFFLATNISPAVLGNKDRQEEHNEIALSFQLQTPYSFNRKEIGLASWCHSSSVPDPIANNSCSAFTKDTLMEETDRESSFLVSGEAVSLTTCLCQQDASTVHGLAQKRAPAHPLLMGLWSLEKPHQESLDLYLFFPIQRERGSQRTPLLSRFTETLPIASAQPSIKPRLPVVTVQIQIQIQFQYTFKSESGSEQWRQVDWV